MNCTGCLWNTAQLPNFQVSETLFLLFSFDAPTLWSDLPDKVCACPTIGSFRQKLKAYLLTKASELAVLSDSSKHAQYKCPRQYRIYGGCALLNR